MKISASNPIRLAVAFPSKKVVHGLLVGLLAVQVGCQPAKPAATTPPQASAATEAAARTAVMRYIQAQPNASLYVVDSARVVEDGTQWQVLVPRTDWARRMPNRAAFEVDKRTGEVRGRAVK